MIFQVLYYIYLYWKKLPTKQDSIFYVSLYCKRWLMFKNNLSLILTYWQILIKI